MAKYEGQDVKSQRPAKEGDPGFDENQDQVVITMQDGSEKTVEKSEVK